MDEQSELNARDEIPLARAGDPVTSHIAAQKLVETGKWRGQKGLVLTWMREHQIDAAQSLTASEMARESSIRHPVCHKRLPDLEAAGWVRKCIKRNCKVTGELCWTWCLTTAEERAASGEPPEGESIEPEEEGGLMPQERAAIQSALAECEAIIERNVQGFVEAGRALLRIRDERLYRAAYKTFEAYCRERWNWSRSYAYRQIDAAKVIENLSPMGDIPENERQARSLATLPPQTQREAWSEAVQASPTGKVSEKVLREKVQAAKQSAPQEKKVKAKPLPAPKGPQEPEVAFLQRILEQVTFRLKEADAIGKRPWNVDACSKRALVQGLYAVYEAMTLRLREFQAKPNRNGHSVHRRETAPELSPGGEQKEIYDPENDFIPGSVN